MGNKEPDHRADPVKVGELQVWDIVNHTPVDHPFTCTASSFRCWR